MDVAFITQKVVIELDEGDAALLLGTLTEMTGRIPSGLRPCSPWTRIHERVADSLGRRQMGDERFRVAAARN